VAADWSDWSECDARCGYGVQIRTKRIIVHPANGGRPCGETIERRLCEGTNCKLPRASDGVEQLKGECMAQVHVNVSMAASLTIYIEVLCVADRMFV